MRAHMTCVMLCVAARHIALSSDQACLHMGVALRLTDPILHMGVALRLTDPILPVQLNAWPGSGASCTLLLQGQIDAAASAPLLLSATA
jgi:hypothetical protein